MLDALGRTAQGMWAELLGTFTLLRAAITEMRALEPRMLVAELYQLGNRSLFFVVFILSATGAIMSVQACLQAQRILGDLSMIGPAFLQLLVREFGPTIVALMVAARYGAGVAAELGAMTVTEQVDALKLAGAQPASYLVLPRVAAGSLGVLPLAVFGTLVAFVAGGLTAHLGFGVSYGTYARTSLVAEADVVVGCTKALAFGVLVPLYSSYSGLSARGGAPGVGAATTRAVIGSSVLVLFADLVISAGAELLRV